MSRDVLLRIHNMLYSMVTVKMMIIGIYNFLMLVNIQRRSKSRRTTCFEVSTFFNRVI